jgi:signal transduction histidine kinase
MHPILAQPRRLGLYLLAWLFAGGLLSLALVFPGGGSALEGLALGLPLGLVYAFVSLAAWYPARAAPLRSAGVSRQLVIHAAAALLSSGAWCVLGVLLARGLARLPLFAGAADRFSAALPFLYPVGALLYLLAVALHYLFVAFEESRAAERQALGLLVLAREAELRALRAQINPHFLFNSLNSISALVADDPQGARRMCELLADFLRQSLRLGALERIPLADELALLANFLAIERVRFGPRLQVTERIADPARGCLLPPLLLQPLVENAVTHGIAQLVAGGEIRVEARREGGLLHLAVENDCDPDRRRRPGTGLGLANVRRRLEETWGREAWLRAREEAGRYRVEITLPAP